MYTYLNSTDKQIIRYSFKYLLYFLSINKYKPQFDTLIKFYNKFYKRHFILSKYLLEYHDFLASEITWLYSDIYSKDISDKHIINKTIERLRKKLKINILR